MPDPLGFLLVGICTITSIITLIIAVFMLRSSPFTPHRFFTSSVVCMTAWMISYIPSVIFPIDPEYTVLMQIALIISFISGVGYVLCIIFTMGTAYKGRFQMPITMTGVFFAGAFLLIFFYF